MSADRDRLQELLEMINNGKPWPKDTVLHGGIYRVGIDITPGEYLIARASDDPDQSAEWEVKNSSRPDAKSIGSGWPRPYCYLTVKSGEYLNLSAGTIATLVREIS